MFSFLILIFVCLISCLIYVCTAHEKGADCVVLQHGKVLMRLSLSTDIQQCIETDDGYNVIEVYDGQVSVIESDCKNQICVHSGPIDKSGQIISCLPHGLIVTIVTDSEQEVDTVAY